MDPQALGKPTVSRPLVAALAIGAVLAAGGAYLWLRPARPTAEVQSVPSSTAPGAAEEPPIEHPVPRPAPAAQQPLPPLAQSDQPVSAAFLDAAGGAEAVPYLIVENLIRNVVVTVDNLPRQKLPLDKRPIMPTAGAFAVDGDEVHATLAAANYSRYTPLVNVLQAADMKRVAAVYLDFYPLFQEAYQDLGYPKGYFNDRLVKAIDVLLATPQVGRPIELTRPNVLYVFADPTLEALPAGQKVLLRMGPANAAVVATKLKELRALVTARTAP